MRQLFHVKRWVAALVLIGMGVAWYGCVVSESPITGRKRAYGYSWEQERQIGQQADQQIIAQFGIYDDPELQNYVERVGQEVLAESHMRRADASEEFRNTPFTFRVLDSPVVNAFALPGGYVYVTRGLMTHLENEAQLAMVLGHEITHVAARHASERALGQQLGQLGLIGGAILGEAVLGIPGQDILNVGGTVTQLLFLRYGRDDERQADLYGVEYAALAGYDAGEGAGFFETLERITEQQGGSIPGWASTHPDPGEREQTIRELAAEWEPRTPMNRVGRESLFDVLEGVVLGVNPRQGFTENGIFYHPDLRFQFPVPNNFGVINQATQVAMVEQNQNAILLFSIAEGSSAREAATSIANQQGIQVLDSGPTSANGLPAYFVLADAQTQEGVAVRLLYYLIEYGGNVYGFLGYSTQQAFSSYQSTFERTMRGFAPLRDSRILNVQPVRIDIAAASRTAPFSAFVPSTLPRDLAPIDLAIINQVGLSEQVPQGRLLKLTQ